MEGEIRTKAILNLPLFDQAEKSVYGIPYYMGEDEFGNSVYIAGFASKAKICERTLHSILRVLGRAEEVILVDALPYICLIAKIGGAFSRGLGWVWIGRPLAGWGIKHSIPSLRRLVRSVKEVIQASND
jgi:hypothetical protein